MVARQKINCLAIDFSSFYGSRSKELYLYADGIHLSKREHQLVAGQELAPWELRIQDYRAFYRVEPNDLVKVAMIGYKEHNILPEFCTVVVANRRPML